MSLLEFAQRITSVLDRYNAIEARFSVEIKSAYGLQEQSEAVAEAFNSQPNEFVYDQYILQTTKSTLDKTRIEKIKSIKTGLGIVSSLVSELESVITEIYSKTRPSNEMSTIDEKWYYLKTVAEGALSGLLTCAECRFSACEILESSCSSERDYLNLHRKLIVISETGVEYILQVIASRTGEIDTSSLSQFNSRVINRCRLT